jgi:VCBS repeat-containing protein
VRLDLKNDSISGNLLTNDIDANGDTLMLRTVGSQKFSNGHLDLAGLYGTLTVQENGDYTYHLYDDAFGIKTSATKITEKFQYKMSDGVAVDTAALVIDVTDFMKAHVAADLLV